MGRKEYSRGGGGGGGAKELGNIIMQTEFKHSD